LRRQIAQKENNSGEIHGIREASHGIFQGQIEHTDEEIRDVQIKLKEI
jgi:hypothetical protein